MGAGLGDYEAGYLGSQPLYLQITPRILTMRFFVY